MLTDERIDEIAEESMCEGPSREQDRAFARAIEAEVLQAQEPVAYLHTEVINGARWADFYDHAEIGSSIDPLYTAPQPPAPSPAPLDESRYCPDCDALQAKVAILDGLSQDAIDGGWTYRGMNAYAVGLEARVAEQAELIEKCEKALGICVRHFNRFVNISGYRSGESEALTNVKEALAAIEARKKVAE